MAQGSPSEFSKFVRCFADRIQELEDAAYDVRTLRYFDVAADAQLDGIGELLGETRQDRSDADYRAAILARIQINASNGEPETIIAAIKALTDTTEVHFVEQYPARIKLNFSSNTEVTSLGEFMQRICAAGVKLDLFQDPLPEPFSFSADSSSHVDATYGFSNAAQVTGGKLSQILT